MTNVSCPLLNPSGIAARIGAIVAPLIFAACAGPEDSVDDEVEDASSQSLLASTVGKFSGYDLNGDGTAEIETAKLANNLSPSMGKKLVLVLVQSRLLDGLPAGQQDYPLLPSISQYTADLEKEGYEAGIVSLKLHASTKDQDGLTLLAVRQLLRAVRNKYPALVGTVLVGDFPNAVLVRQAVWPQTPDKSKQIAINDANGAIGVTKKVTVGGDGLKVFHISAYQVADAADIVLADLDGHWEDLYHEELFVQGLFVVVDKNQNLAAAPISLQSYPVKLFGTNPAESVERHDVFYLPDAPLALVYRIAPNIKAIFNPYPGHKISDFAPAQTSGSWCVDCTLTLFPVSHPEASAADKLAVNTIARPEIFVSRINTRHVALSPDLSLVGLDGKKLIDTSGKPQTVQFDTKSLAAKIAQKQMDGRCVNSFFWTDGYDCLWSYDASLERRLLKEYFARNHAYRTGTTFLPGLFRPAAINYGDGLKFGGLYTSTAEAHFEWKGLSESTATANGLAIDGASLEDYVEWLGRPALYRAIKAHSGPIFSGFGPSKPGQSLANVIGGYHSRSWRFSMEPSTPAAFGFGPSYADQNLGAEFYLYRTLYENGSLSCAGPRIYMHEGCETMSPMGNGNASHAAYNSGSYGRRQNAESLLHFTNGLAVVGRSVVGYDWAEGFNQTLGAGPENHLGAGLSAYYDVVSQATITTLDDALSSKRAYPWLIYGDWTLTIRKAPEAGTCSVDAEADGVYDKIDNCPNTPNVKQLDWDKDGRGDACDNCASEANGDQKDQDKDGYGDVCDPDVDGDGVAQDKDNCPHVHNPPTGAVTCDEATNTCVAVQKTVVRCS